MIDQPPHSRTRPLGNLELLRHRGGLARARRRLAEGRLVVGFVGGSITDPRTGHNWPGPVAAWLVENFPDARIVVENAAIGATGSDLAVFRAERDLVARGCDVVFIEYAVNDRGAPSPRRARMREGLIRKLLAGEGRDLVLAHTFCQDMWDEMRAGRVPASIAEMEALGEHYGIGSVWMGLWALEEVLRGRMRWEEWLPDGLHPQHRGSASYAEAVITFLQAELLGEPRGKPIPAGRDMPPPLDERNWQDARAVPLDQIATEGPWALHRWPYHVWIDQVLATTAPGARAKFAFEGRVLALGLDFGKAAADFRWRLDGGAWADVRPDRPPWCGPEGWFRLLTLADDLPPGRHEVELEVMHGGEGCVGCNFRLALVGVVL